jgi:outer membrane protein assembly factor BamB
MRVCPADARQKDRHNPLFAKKSHFPICVDKSAWTSRQLKPDFADLVSYQGYAYSNDGGLLTCIDLKTGERKWKGGRYGEGQILLLENSGMLLILSEKGKVALVAAEPAAYREVASFQALGGKAWNHPVVVGDRLYVRNSQEAAAYQLAEGP